ncbi:hypothetical protein ACRJ4B_33335 [Streptomyces sp. GTA36]
MRSHTQKIRNQIDAGNMGKLADEVLKAAVANHGFWGDEWCELFDTLRDLPVEERRRLAHALIECFGSLGTEPETRQKVLTLLGIIAHDLPEDFFLPTERLAELQSLGARSTPTGTPRASTSWRRRSSRPADSSRPPSWPSSVVRPWSPTARSTSWSWSRSSPPLS